MKERKKFLTVLLVCGMFLMVCGCGGKEASDDVSSSEGTDESSMEEVESTGEDYPISIEDIDWGVKGEIVSGINIISFGYTNNTDYAVVDVEMTFTQKDDITAEQLTVFDSLKEDRDWSDEDVAQIYILGYNRKYADPGETVYESPCVINGTYTLVETMEQYELMEPAEIRIAYIAPDDKMYMMTYDFETQEYSYSSRGEDIHEWSDSDISSLLPEAEFKVVKVKYDEEDYFSFSAYGVLDDEFEAYVDACKEIGFTNVEFESDSSYRALNADNYEVSIDYTFVEESMTGRIEKDDTADEEKPTPEETDSIEEAIQQDSTSGIRPEFKDMMDSYEAFFDEYCEFMKKYNESDDVTSMLADYTDYMTKYVEFMGKLDEVDEDELSTEEALYYAEVSARISKKILEVAQ